jgi:CRP/FNR family transcriptional regulator
MRWRGWSVLGPDFWRSLIGGAEIVRVGASELVYECGQPAPCAVVLSGSVRVYIWSADGRQFTVRYAGPGQMIGLGFQLGGVDSSSAEALTECEVALISFERLRAAALENPALAWSVAEQVAAWGLDVLQSLADAARLPITGLVAKHLLEIARRTTGGEAAAITHQRLADAVGTAREVVTRALGVIRQAGMVDTASGYIRILDPERLEVLAAG